MTDLRDQLPAGWAAAVELIAGEVHHDGARALRIVELLLGAGWTPPGRPTCHPTRDLFARGLCEGCYDYHRRQGTLDHHGRTTRPVAEFAADFALLRSEGYTRRQIAERLGMRRNTVDAAYRRAVKRGLLAPDRRSA